MTFPWEVDAQPGRFRSKRDRDRHAKLQHSFAASRRDKYKKHGHPEWYSAYLKTEHWKSFKRRWKAKTAWVDKCCCICGERRYELHHRTYERIGDERLDDVVALCRAHHARAHKREKAGAPLWDAHLEDAIVMELVDLQE